MVKFTKDNLKNEKVIEHNKYRKTIFPSGRVSYYVKGTGTEIFIGKYRDLDDFEREINAIPTWHNKYYVDEDKRAEVLFCRKKEADKYLKRRIGELYQKKIKKDK